MITTKGPALFKDRTDAGRILAGELSDFMRKEDVLILALPRGGVPVGFEVARALGVPLDIFMVRKLGVPGHEEYAMGAIASGGIQIMNDDVVRSLKITRRQIEEAVDKERRELLRRERAYRGDRPEPEIRGHRIIIVDDGFATGASMRAAVAAVRAYGPLEIIVAVPTAAPEACADLEKEADRVVCAKTPRPFHAVGLWYEDFSQTTDEEVRELLRKEPSSA